MPLAWPGVLARAAALLLLLGGVFAASRAMQAHHAEQARVAEALQVAALEARIARAQQQLEARVWRLRERFAHDVGSQGLLAARTRRLGNRIAVHRAAWQGELEAVGAWPDVPETIDTPEKGGWNENERDHDDLPVKPAPRRNSVWLRHAEPVRAG